MRAAVAIFVSLFMVLVAAQAGARSVAPGQGGPDNSLSPYFLVDGDESVADGLPLKSTRADVKVSGPIAHVKVTQVYENTGDKTIEAIYVFPGSTRAAVFGMKMTIDDRVIVAEIQKKDEARKIYEAAKAAGKSASLLEQKRPNVFQMNVANIMPGDVIKVEMDYTEVLIPTDGTYEFVYPAVVGPRFTGEGTAEDVDPGLAEDDEENFFGIWTSQAFLKAAQKAPYTWDVAVNIDGGVPIRNVGSSSHSLDVDYSRGKTRAEISLDDPGAAGTKDFVLKYKLTGDAVESGLLLFEGSGKDGDDENFFLAMVQPPERVEKRAMPKREYIFILDVSGSMHGYPLETAKTTLRGLLAGMNRGDRFNIMTFSGGAKVLFEESQAVTAVNVDKAEELLANIRGGGGTRILGALEKALALPTPNDFSRTFVAVTDGYVSVEARVFELIRQNLGTANFFAFGIGSSVNRHLIEGMARAGMGEPFIVMHGDDAAEHAAKLEKYLNSPVLTDISVDFDGFDAYDVEPASVPDLFASRPVMVFGKYRGDAKGRIKVSGIGGEGRYTNTLDVSDYQATSDNTALKYLWARTKVAELADFNRLRKTDERVKQVTDLGLKYGLMTAYTSFVAVDSLERNTSGDSQTVKQPLPLPDGVSNLAVGGAVRTKSASRSTKRRYRRGGRGAPMAQADESVAASPAPMPALAVAATPKPTRPATKTEVPKRAEKEESKASGGCAIPGKANVSVVSAPAGIDKAKLLASLKRLVTQLNACGSCVTGSITFNLELDGNGKVVRVTVASDPIGGPTAGCVRRGLLALSAADAVAGSGTFTVKVAVRF